MSGTLPRQSDIDTHLHVPYLFNLNRIHDSDDHWPLPLVKPFLCSVMFMYSKPIELLSVGVRTLGKLRLKAASQRQLLHLVGGGGIQYGKILNSHMTQKLKENIQCTIKIIYGNI